MSNPETQQILMQVQMVGGDANTKTPPSISREKAKQIFFKNLNNTHGIIMQVILYFVTRLFFNLP